MNSPGERFARIVLAAVFGLIACMALMHWAACEQDDAVCMFTGEDSK